MSAQEIRTASAIPRPDFDCEIDPKTGTAEEACLREYLRRNLPLAV